MIAITGSKNICKHTTPGGNDKNLMLDEYKNLEKTFIKRFLQVLYIFINALLCSQMFKLLNPW